MLDTDSKKWLKSLLGDNVRFDEPMSEHTSFKVGGPADAYLLPETRSQLTEIITMSGERGLKYVIVGGGTNLLVRDKGIRGLVIVLTQCLNQIQSDSHQDGESLVSVMAGAKLGRFCAFAIRHGLRGMNFALGIPGTVGGAMMMNAGTAMGSIRDVLESVDILLPTGQIRQVQKSDMRFEYRSFDIAKTCKLADIKLENGETPILLGGHFRLCPADPKALRTEAVNILKTRKKKQPTRLPSAGCFFKNPPPLKNGGTSAAWTKPAGALIDLAGLRGKRIGGAEVSPKHANFIVNRDRAIASDILALMELIQETVSRRFQIDLDPEVKIIGE